MKQINWETGTYQAPEIQNKQGDFRITIAADWGALWDYADIMQRDPLAVYGDLLPLFRNSDCNIVGIECTLGEKGAPINKGGPHLRGAAGTEKVLSKIPFHLGCLANNHIMDFGSESLEETMRILQAAGVKTVGAGMSGAQAAKPAIIQMKSAALGIINCAEGESCASINGGPGAHPFDIRALEEQVHNLKKQVDTVLVIFHGGREYAPSPPPYVVEGLRRLADAGACAVIAQHPHVPQGAEIYHGVPIAYSQGNFVFRWADTNNDAREYLTLGYLLHLDFAGKDLVGFSLTPYQMKREGVFALAGQEKIAFLEKLKRVSDVLNDPQKIKQAWEAFVDSEGEEWMLSVLQAQLDTFKKNPALSAARLRNVFFCPAHRELYIDGLGRIARGEVGNSPQWAKELVSEWQKVSEDKPND